MNMINLPKSWYYLDDSRWSNRISYPLVVEYEWVDPFLMDRIRGGGVVWMCLF